MVVTDERWYSEIADAIRTLNACSDSYAPSQMADAILRLPINANVNYFADYIAESIPNTNYLIGNSATKITNPILSNETLEYVIYPRVSDICSSAYCRCSALRVAEFPRCLSVGMYAFSGCQMLSRTSFERCVTIGSNAFTRCSSLASISLPNCVSIYNTAFAFCGLSDISVPLCTSLYSYAFSSCASLANASFGTCSIVGGYAFNNCQMLSNVTIPNCTQIQLRAFQNCYRLTSVDLTNASVVPTLGNSVFYSTPIEGFTSYAGGYGSIYVNGAMYDAFISDSQWSRYAGRIVAV